MGSKRVLLREGLGESILNQARNCARVVDLFCGAASVSWFAASKTDKPVLSCDLQEYATTLAGSVVQRTKPVDARLVDKLWLSAAGDFRSSLEGWDEALSLDQADLSTYNWRENAQKLCASEATSKSSLILRCYGGHYFSPTQALTLDAMLQVLPDDKLISKICLAATIIAAGDCAASPGHTAQPFKATSTAESYLRNAWLRDPFYYARKALVLICPLHAEKRGVVHKRDANTVAEDLKPSDLVFIDPPYSSVQYSRFYHVLETIARKSCSFVSGIGRYPPITERPNSYYCKKSSSLTAITELLKTLSGNGCRVILTYPQGQCSNGLAGEKIAETAKELFKVQQKSVHSVFSTLGGNKTTRDARKTSPELILELTPI